MFIILVSQSIFGLEGDGEIREENDQNIFSALLHILQSKYKVSLITEENKLLSFIYFLEKGGGVVVCHTL